MCHRPAVEPKPGGGGREEPSGEVELSPVAAAPRRAAYACAALELSACLR